MPINIASRYRYVLSLCALLCLAVLSGCDQPETPGEQPSAPIAEPISDLTRQAWNHYHINGVDIISQPVACIALCKQTITRLIQSPTQELLDTARSQIKTCKETYLATKLFTAANQATQNKLVQLHQRINSTLEMPGFVDSVKSYPYSGIVNDTSIALSKKTLISEHGTADSDTISLGFSVIEFLLWGEHLYDDSIEPRSLESLTAISAWPPQAVKLGLNELDISEHANNRRRRYLELALLILESDLNQLATVWNKNTLPPLNKAAAAPIKQNIINHLSRNLDTVTLDVLLPLFTDSTTSDGQLAATPFSQWLGIANDESFNLLLNDATPVATKQKSLASLIKAI